MILQRVSQQPITRLLVEKGIITREELLALVRVGGQKMKSKGAHDT